MKNNYSIVQRNALVEEMCIRDSWCTMKKIQLYGLCLKRYNEDVFQGEVS